MDNGPKTANENTEFVAECVSDLLSRLQTEMGIPADQVIAGAHAQIVTMLGAMVGGEAAYEHCIAAGHNIRPMLSLDDALLAASTPHGRA